ncbi:hypothetical protein OGAPHI_002337 [Ogataea philodendri]|uniref:Uncharacterized protein n=1 Tax=Ogataea philodendri TaxID=1378263 RepID=A0A9P8T6Y5_9ASCO|nr:uncharacterized protein OGAPHI_002337 [Ogataea philodendri]KAH3668583.1 hypothetical protein OGAPHI_002337 [Ogataea philodendri]
MPMESNSDSILAWVASTSLGTSSFVSPSVEIGSSTLILMVPVLKFLSFRLYKLEVLETTTGMIGIWA